MGLYLAASLAGTLLCAPPADPLDSSNVVWTTPSADSSGSMPLGNGDLGVNLWVEAHGDLLAYLSKTDAWDATGRLLKLGRLRVHLDPNPFAPGRPFRQTLRLRQGEVLIEAAPVTVRVWAEAHAPVLRVATESAEPVTVTVALEVWRTAPRTLAGGELFSAYSLAGGPEPVVQDPDVVLADQPDRVVWYHRNERSTWASTMRHQGLESLIPQLADPLLGRTFGGWIAGDGLVRRDDHTLATAAPTRRCVASVHVLTRQTDSAAAWVAALADQVRQTNAVDLEAARQRHRDWWDAFWNRSWIRVTDPSPLAATGGLTTNDLPLRIGADSDGGNGFRGAIRRCRVWSRALPAADLAALAAAPDGAPPAQGLLGDWTLAGSTAGVVPNAANPDLPAKVVGRLTFAEGAAQFGEGGWLEVADHPNLDLTQAVTLEAWVRPGDLPGGGGRILDKSRAGTSNGYLLDTYPGRSLRLIVAAGTAGHPASLPRDAWVHVAASFDAATGQQLLYVGGRQVAQQQLARAGDAASVGEAVTRGYTLQRFINACGGRGAQPIKFNGSIFTVDTPDGQRWDADYRRWGDCYWFQNTRLPYWAMLPAGDLDLMQPLWRMYRDALPLAIARTRLYFGHDGAFFPETMTFWGAYANQNYGWDRAGKPSSQVDNRYIRWYWSGGLELLAMLLDTLAASNEPAFATDTLLPLARAVLTFYDQHYPRRDDGRIRFQPAAALETWQDAIDPLPEIAGLRFVLDGLLALPDALVGADRAGWERLRAQLPPVPLKTEGEAAWILPAAEVLEGTKNVENAELYAVFPYRLYGVGRPDLEVGRATFARRQFRRTGGWQQDAIHAACLGLTADAQAAVVHNFSRSHAGSRFPAFWGPNYDWVPDQDHGGVAMTGLQRMLLQEVGSKILLCPAWPPEWDVAFRLHASRGTVVTGEVRGGKLEHLTVTPERRRADVVVRLPEG